MLPIESFGTPADKSLALVITIGVLAVNVSVVALHSKVPQAVVPVSNQYVPLAGSPLGRVNVAVSSLRSMSAL